MRVSNTDETVVQTSAKKANPESIKIFQIVFGLDQKSFNKTTVVPYENYLRNFESLRSTAEYQSVVKELTVEKSTPPVIMIIKKQDRAEAFRLDEFYDILNAKPTNLEQVIRTHVNQVSAGQSIEFTKGEEIQIGKLLNTLDMHREARGQLESFEDDIVLVTSEKGQLTAGELKRALNINFSSTKPLDESEKKLIGKIANVGRGENIEFPHTNFNKKNLEAIQRVNQARDQQAQQFQDISVGHQTSISRDLSRLNPKSLDDFVLLATTRVGAVNKTWANEHGKPDSRQLQANIMAGLHDANDTMTQKQRDIQNQQSRTASSSQSDLSSRSALIDLKLQTIECEEKIRCIDNLAKFTKGNRTLADQNRVNLRNPEFLRQGWENSPGLVHRQRSLEEINTDWPTEQVTQSKAVDEGKKRQPAQLQPQRSLDAQEFQVHMQKVERAEAQQRTESKPQPEQNSSQKEKRLSLNRDPGQPSQSAKESPLIQRLVRARRSNSVSEAPKPDPSAGSTTKKM